MKYDINIIGTVITLLLTGLAILFRDSIIYAIILIFFAVLIALITIIRYAFAKRIKVFFQSKKAKDFAEEIYKLAATKGGKIYATHIFPRFEIPLEYLNGVEIIHDIAIKQLIHVERHVNIDFERILIFNNPDIERQWVKELYKKLNNNINLKIWILKKYPIVFNRLTKDIIPRINILLYKHKSQYITQIGFDKIFSKPKKTLSIIFYSQIIYNNVKEYFTEITDRYEEIVSVQNFSEYISTCKVSQRCLSFFSLFVKRRET